MRLRAVLDWLFDVTNGPFSRSNDDSLSSRRAAVRVRRDGQTEVVPVDDSTPKLVLLPVLAVIALLVALLSMKVGQVRTGMVPSAVSSAIC